MKEESLGCIYLFWCAARSKGYVGQHNTLRPEKRWYGHRRDAEKGKRHPLQCAIRKYGWAAFTRSVVWRGPVSRLNEKEIYYIKKFRTFIDDSKGGGYNLTTGGYVTVLSKRTRKRMSAFQRARYMNSAEIEGLSKIHLQSYKDPEIKERHHRGVSKPETRQRMALSAKRRWAKESERKKASAATLRAYKLDPSLSGRMSKAQHRRYEDPAEHEKARAAAQCQWVDEAYRKKAGVMRRREAASKTSEERSAIALRGVATRRARYTAEEISAMHRKKSTRKKAAQ